MSGKQIDPSQSPPVTKSDTNLQPQALKSGASLSNDLLPDELRWLDSPQHHHTPSIKSSRTHSYGSDRSDQSSAGRSMRVGGPKY